MDLTTHPGFLLLAMKAQESFSKSFNISDNKSLKGRFAVLDMLDMLDKHMAKDNRDAK